MIGLRSHGVELARRLAEKLQPDFVGTLDITLYRDDLAGHGAPRMIQPSEIAFPIDGLNVVLVDDVLMTGRSARAALAQLMDLGRPRRVWLSVLVDRGGRELPIAADHVGLDLRQAGSEAANVTLDAAEKVLVALTPTDDRDAIVVQPAPPQEATP